MATFSEERAPPCSVGSWELVAMVETQDSHEEAVRGARCEEESEPIKYEHPSFHRVPRANRPVW